MDQGQGQDQAQGHEKVRQRSALLQLQMALSLVLALTLVLALVRNIIIFSKVRVLVLNQPISIVIVLGILYGEQKRSRNGFLHSQTTNRRHESA